ncbi:UDP-N-acetylmuramoyl-L-alanyl-D-glutamate--2,6-diaminopimelate ligase [Permianibacter sp. IMCC34836]|uniref:UDP-N-acetylmuramoyl-L-alanyl-D-glutamate--2, 6-diaminopimelate ligase n=1 Tax=Permianibacter fluminis TaxID=2738515 RepID=UPI001555219C|nr:UDP-N-acetylmuramoyl-L-alanyl-D-glutamate--2,6-diaminopimelate ligase [Permianibacter fluminis]NQD37009.1 UDP-N-acetylmuramoyl-L-alanyl-D-glutamate--2,6-diaminopimelate ligase [Permianibacter fluminis]
MSESKVTLTLQQLLAGESVQVSASMAAIPVTRLTLDSRDVQFGDIFIALAGTATDGRKFIADAFARGAVAALTETANGDERLIAVPNLRMRVSALAAKTYDDASAAMPLYAVTGTNGKTTTSQLLAAALTRLTGPTFVLGTLGYGLFGELQPGRHTTPDAIALQRLLAEGLKQGARAAAMEVSSHGLDQGRVEALHFRTAIFTNLTRDHLDYHGTMAAYGAAKRRLFVWPALQHAVINADDEFGRELLADPAITASKYSYGVRAHAIAGIAGSVHAERIHYSSDGILAEIVTPWGRKLLQSPLLGEFNLSNLLAALTALCANGFSLDEVAGVLGTVQPIAGRMERFGGGEQPLVVVDYAHTPDALEKALMALRLHCHGKVAVVFGCGGDRDKGKRPEMGAIAERFADDVVLSNDNPRSEAPLAIANDIRAGMKAGAGVRFIADRQQAIATVLAELQAGDALLLAGKGHEAYVEANGQRTPYSEVAVVQTLLQNLQGARR